jgi:hypothetical protein
MLRSIGLPELLVICTVALFFVWPWSKIFSKAGYPGWLSVLMLIPLLNIVLIFWFAFSDWPNLNRNTKINA